LCTEVRAYPKQFGQKFAAAIPSLVATAAGKPCYTSEDRANFDAKKVFASMKFTDLCEDAGLPELLRYLYGNHSLDIPESWRCIIPSKLKREA
jgi:hypothetical protein